MRNVTLVLEDGTKFHGKSFGYEAPVAGEVVFNTAMMGYPESLTDPSYAGQLMTLTYPLVGNYGVPPFTFEANGLPTFMESDKIYASAIIVADYSEQCSHWNAVETLAEWLKREKVPGITGIDTRELTKVLREHGVMMGKILFDDEPNNIPQAEYEGVNFVDLVSCKEIIRYNEGADKKVVLVDCGVKANIIRCLINRGVEVIRVPWNYDYTDMEFDGLFLANGPGDPDMCEDAVKIIRKQMSKSDKPILDVLDTQIKTSIKGEERLLEDWNREVLKGFYSVFKAADANLQFVLLTGVTKFSQVSVFSGFNQPNDISMDEHYEALCGITEEELYSTFDEQIKAMAVKI